MRATPRKKVAIKLVDGVASLTPVRGGLWDVEVWQTWGHRALSGGFASVEDARAEARLLARQARGQHRRGLAGSKPA